MALDLIAMFSNSQIDILSLMFPVKWPSRVIGQYLLARMYLKKMSRNMYIRLGSMYNAQKPGKDFKWRLSHDPINKHILSYWYLTSHSIAKEDLGRGILKVQVNCCSL